MAIDRERGARPTTAAPAREPFAIRPVAWFAVDNGVGIPNEEQGSDVRVCRGPSRPWSRLWPDLRHYD